MSIRTYRVGNGFGGMAGAALGFMMATESLFGTEGRFELSGAVDFDQYACDVYKLFTGAEEACLDVEKMTIEDMHRVFGIFAPDVMCGSPPCKGSSKLLGTEKAKLPKYEQMNRLALLWTRLLLKAWPDAPPRILIYENVPNITTRARAMLVEVRKLLRAAGYALQDGFHNCGEVGNLAQHRKRWFMVARLERCEKHPERCVPAFLYKPPKRGVRGCGEELQKLPLPGDPEAGPMHELPNVAAVQWFRLAAIPAGGDHRDLKHVLEGAPRRTKFRRHHVEKWTDPSITIAGTGSNGPVGVADPRPGSFADIAPRPEATFHHVDRVTPWTEPVGTITHSPAPSSGAPSVADPRPGSFAAVGPRKGGFTNIDHVGAWDAPARAVTGATRPGQGAPSIGDPRFGAAFKGSLGVTAWTSPSGAVTGEAYPTTGRFSVADPRLGALPLIPQAGNANMHDGKYVVVPWNGPAKTITGASRVGSGAQSVADPRITPEAFPGAWGVRRWEEPSGAITGNAGHSTGAFSVADPRIQAGGFRGAWGVLGWGEPAGAVTGNARHSTGTFSIADPLVRAVLHVEHAYDHGYAVLGWSEPSATIASKSYVGCGAYSVADPRPPIALNCTPRAGSYGVLPWSEAAKVITGSASVDNGAFAVADPRVPDAPPIAIVDRWDRPPFRLEADAKGKVRRVPVPLVILSEDGTWHRPLTTLELLALQSFPTKIQGRYVRMPGGTTAQRQAIGNAIPPQAMKSMAEQMLLALVASDTGCFYLDKGGAGIWVRRPEVEAELQRLGIERVDERRPWRIGGAVVCDDGAIVQTKKRKKARRDSVLGRPRLDAREAVAS